MDALGRIYLDYAATAPMRSAVAEAMAEWWSTGPGNASSLHAEGRRARMAVDEARERVAATVGCEFAEVCFTGSGTEAVNLALIGTALSPDRDPQRDRVLVSAGEHHAVLHTLPVLQRLGMQTEVVPIDHLGALDLPALSARLGPDVALVAVMQANNEVGTHQPISEAVALAHAHGAQVLVDAVQTFARATPRAWDLGADLVAASAHKIGGPPGVGMLAARAGVPLEAVTRGGGQERERRAGTENVAGIIGFGLACQLAVAGAAWELARARAARDAFERSASHRLGDHIAWTLPATTPRLPGHTHFRIPGITAETLLIRLDREGIAASSGAACSSGSVEPSHVVRAMGRGDMVALESIRFTFGAGSTPEDAERAAKVLATTVAQILQTRAR